MKVVGFMSGTSMDGLDAVLMETDGEKQMEVVGHCAIDYDAETNLFLNAVKYAFTKASEGHTKTKEQITEEVRDNFSDFICSYFTNDLNLKKEAADKEIEKINEHFKHLHGSPVTFDTVEELLTQLREESFNKLLAQEDIDRSEIDLVGDHGQTVFHKPENGVTIQLGDGQELANRLGVTVVNDFRSNDVAHGGQGAPLAPLYHLALADSQALLPLVVVYLGGIANMTFMRSSLESGFDTGPANYLVNLFVRQRTEGREDMDKDGKYGGKAEVNKKVLNELREQSVRLQGENYFNKKPPKSLDTSNLLLVSGLDELSIEEGCATLEAFTAETIVNSLDLLDLEMSEIPENWVLVGGGAENPVIRDNIEDQLNTKLGKKVNVQKAADIGWKNKSLEAEIFAFLAVRALKGLPLSLPESTGVSEPLTGGHAYIPEGKEASPEVKALINANLDVLRGYKAYMPVAGQPPADSQEATL